jgi:biotin carboxyl carrier protein
VAAPAPAPAPVAAAAPAGAATVNSPMPGTILDIKVSVGQQVAANEVLLVLEAMKMENDIVTATAGTVAAIHVNKGDSVDTGALLVSIS